MFKDRIRDPWLGIFASAVVIKAPARAGAQRNMRFLVLARKARAPSIFYTQNAHQWCTNRCMHPGALMNFLSFRVSIGCKTEGDREK